MQFPTWRVIPGEGPPSRYNRQPLKGQFKVPVITSRVRDRYGSISMFPDWAIVKELKRIDPRLRVDWNRAKERWVIYETGYVTGRDHIVMRVEEDDGSYRSLDQRVTKELEYIKWLSRLNTANWMRRFEEEEQKLEEEKEKSFTEAIHNIGDYYALQLLGIPQSQVPSGYENIK